MKKLFFTSAIFLIFSNINISAQFLPNTKKGNDNNGFTVEQQRKIFNVMSAISTFYVDTINAEQLTETAIVSMLKELDPHSVYVPAKYSERSKEPLEGNFEGIGIQFQMFEDTLLVVQTIAGCPAAKVGVLPGDKIIYVENQCIAGVKKKLDDIPKLLRGPKGSEVSIKILRQGSRELLIFNIIRDKIPIHSVDAHYMVADKIGYIKINNFGRNTLDEYKSAMWELQQQGMEMLILSLQSNGGGYIDVAVALADEFLSKNRQIVYTEGLHQQREQYFSTATGDFEKNKLIILVNEYSASASEILSGAVQDWDRGLIVGRRTFGKGLVQRELPLIVDGSFMRLTVARYYTPAGRCIQKPYADYDKDLLNRYEHGELQHADSIHFADSLKYQTKIAKRTVYGGGGIMPDVFVPLDTTTTNSTDYHRKLVNRGVINRCYLQYLNKNRDKLKLQFADFKQFNKNFGVDEELLDMLKERAETEKIAFNEEQYEKSKPLIKLQLKALIAGDLWTTNEYYQVIDCKNDELQRAIEILKTKGEYEKLLKNK